MIEDNTEVEDPELTAMREEIATDPRGFLRRFNLKRWRDQVDFHFEHTKRPDTSKGEEPTRYELAVLKGLNAKSTMFAGIDYQHPTKPLAKRLEQRRKKNKLARNSRKRNRG